MSSIRRWIDRAATPRPHPSGFMGLNDRTLADIGVRRIDVRAAQSGILPAGRIGARRTPTAEVCLLREVPCREANEVAEDEFSVAA